MNNKIIELENEIIRLQKENNKLRNIIVEHGLIIPSSEMTTDEKVRIFMDYFSGRSDVVAFRHERKDGRKGYTPACENRGNWSKGCIFQNGKFMCEHCASKKEVEYTSQIVLRHFKEKSKYFSGIGIYPMQKDNTVKFLTIDFDKENWFDEMHAVYQHSKRIGFPCIMERSESGAGGHLWFFFSEPIPALKARKLGNHLLSVTMEHHSHIRFTSFDRMFPNQDYLPEKGYGNLIALPLACGPLKNQNSAFIDEHQKQYTDQIGALCSIQKISEKEIDRKIISKDPLKDYFIENDQFSMHLNLDAYYSPEIHIVENSMLVFDKKTLNEQTISRIRKTASTWNPKYYEMQKMHLPIHESTVPRVLSEVREDENVIRVPRGLLPKIKEIFVDSIIRIENQTVEGHQIDVKFKGELFDYQKEPFSKLISHNITLFQAIPGFGKTVIALSAIAHHSKSTLIVVPTKELMHQWMERIEEYLEIPQFKKKRDTYVGVFHGAKKKLKGNLDIATAASIASAENREELLSQYGVVIIDECHHAASTTFIQVLQEVKSRIIYSFTATPERKDGLEKIMMMYCGQKCYDSHRDFKKPDFEQVLIPRYTSTNVFSKANQFQDAVNELVENENRNHLIVSDLIHEFNQNRRIIALSDRVRHLENLYERTKDISANVFMLHGEMKEKEKRAVREQLSKLSSNEPYLIFSTSTLLGEGFDMPSLDTLFLTTPASWKNRIQQYAGRIHRKSEKKEIVKIYDYVDAQSDVMMSSYQKRLQQYYFMGYKLQENNQIVELDKHFINSYKEIKETISKDFRYASKEILISSDVLKTISLKEYHLDLLEASRNGVTIRFMLSNIEMDKETDNMLQSIRAEIIHCKNNPAFITIDRALLWHGNGNLFSKRSTSMSMMRIKDKKIIDEMVDGVKKHES